MHIDMYVCLHLHAFHLSGTAINQSDFAVDTVLTIQCFKYIFQVVMPLQGVRAETNQQMG